MINIRNYLENLIPKIGNSIFISIDGHGGSGKSTLANYLSDLLSAEVIHTDDFAGWNNPLNSYLDVIESIFEPIQNGDKSLNYQPVQFWKTNVPEPVIEQAVTKVMILEGVGSSRREFDSFVSLRIFVETPIDICLKRGIARDSHTKINDQELSRLWAQWCEEEIEYFQTYSPKDRADIVLNGLKPFIAQIANE